MSSRKTFRITVVAWGLSPPLPRLKALAKLGKSKFLLEPVLLEQLLHDGKAVALGLPENVPSSALPHPSDPNPEAK